MTQNELSQTRPVARILSRVGRHFMEQQPARQSGDGASCYAGHVGFQGFWKIISTWPGSGKTRDATEFVNLAWKVGYKGLYLMLSHDLIDERVRALEGDGEAGHWNLWKGHDKDCTNRDRAEAGYSASGYCGCQIGVRIADRPTLAPLEFALPRLPGRNRPFLEESEMFDFWVMDEMDFGRLLDRTSVSRDDVDQIAETHPDSSVKVLSKALSKLMLRPSSRLHGAPLYDALEDALKGDTALRKLSVELEDANLPLAPWLDNATLPVNFPPVLVPVMLEEIDAWLYGREFNPRIHISTTNDKDQLRIRWRRELDLFDPELSLPPFFILDATADTDLLRVSFPTVGSTTLPTPDWPEKVYLHQWVGALVSRQTLGVRSDTGTFSPRSVSDRKRWYRKITDNLTEFPREWPIGVITHKAIHEETKKAIEQQGFTDVRSLHYGAERGSNALKDVRILVMLGLPIPNGDDFIEETRAFLHDEGVLDFTWERKEHLLTAQDGSTATVHVGGYWQEPVASYYQQKCQSGLYQAINRIRPYDDQDYDRHVFVYTNMPIPGIEVAQIMRTETDERFVRAVGFLDGYLDSVKECTVTELAQALGGSISQRSMQRWITRKGDSIAAEVGANFAPGHGRSPGMFVRQEH